MTSHFKCAHSKALQTGCLFRFVLPTFNDDTVSHPLTSQVEPPNIGVLEQVLPRSLIPVLPHLKDISVIRILKDHGGLLLHDQAGGPRCPDLHNLLENSLYPLGGETEGGFIEKQESRPDHQGSRQRKHLLPTPAHLAGLSLLLIQEPGKEGGD